MMQPEDSTALLALDLENGVLERYDADAAVERCARAIAAAREAGVAVIYVRLAFRPGHPEVSVRNRVFADVRNAESFVDGTTVTEIDSRVAPTADEPVVVKKRVSAFAGSDLEIVLRSRAISQIACCGVATSGVVLSTVCAAADRDYRITVLSDACGDRDPEVHRFLITQVLPLRAEIALTETWARQLLARK
jgi:nicotinamidase-related amidase